MAVTQLDTPVIKMAAESDALTGLVVDVNYLHWVSKGAIAGDDLLVSDVNGDIIWEEVADGANYSKLFVLKHPVNGLVVTTMDSGTLYVIKASSDGWPG